MRTAETGLFLDVRRPSRPGLRVEAAGRGLFLIRQESAGQAAEAVLFGRVDPDWEDVAYLRTDRFRSPIPPLRAAWATTGASWAHRFATALTAAANGPLHTGRWVISWDRELIGGGSAAGRLHPADRDELDWISHSGLWRFLPLRALSSPDSGRVKAYRKLARAGVLPPVLLWWISALQSHVVLDGHDRLVAAIAEDREPRLLALSTVDVDEVARDTEAALERYLATEAKLMPEQALVLGRLLGRDLRAIEAGDGRTRAWPLRGGSAAWTRLVRAHAPDWA